MSGVFPGLVSPGCICLELIFCPRFEGVGAEGVGAEGVEPDGMLGRLSFRPFLLND